MAMVFANLDLPRSELDSVESALFQLLDDDSVFVKSWAMAILAVLARRKVIEPGELINRMKTLRKDESTAIRTRADKVIRVLENEDEPIPESWVKREV